MLLARATQILLGLLVLQAHCMQHVLEVAGPVHHSTASSAR
jgi:hypothetical protein